MTITITLQDIFTAGMLALFFTWLILNISKVFKVVISHPSEFNYRSSELNKIMQRCYSLFPKEIVQFRGKTFKRGMTIRVTTSQNKSFEGELIGINNENMLCVLTSRYIIAQEISSIEEMVLIE